VRVYLWGTGEVPTQDPTLVLEIPLNQIRLRYIRTLSEDIFLEIHVPNLDIPFEAGRNWITVQPRDERPGEGGYYWICRNADRPLQGTNSYIKDGPNGQGGWGFTDGRSAGSQGLGAADSYARIEGCFDPMTISVEGECGGLAQFAWAGAPPDATLTILYARQTGSVRLPPNLPCGGTQLGLGHRLLQVAFTVQTGEGSGMAERFLPAAACPGYFQAVIGGTGPCQVSNVVGTP